MFRVGFLLGGIRQPTDGEKEKAMAEIDVTVDDALANDAKRVLDEIGMDMETAVRVFLKQIVADGKLPLEVSEERVTNH